MLHFCYLTLINYISGKRHVLGLQNLLKQYNNFEITVFEEII